MKDPESDKTDYVNQSLNRSAPDTTASAASAPATDAVPVFASTLSELEKRIGRNRIGRTVLPDGKVVSTVRLSFAFGPEYETMVFPDEEDFGDLDCDRYATEDEARAGHEAMVAKWSPK